MFHFVRFATIVYVLIVFTGGYVAAATLKGLWNESHRFERLAFLSEEGGVALDHTLTAFEPAAGDSAQ